MPLRRRHSAPQSPSGMSGTGTIGRAVPTLIIVPFPNVLAGTASSQSLGDRRQMPIAGRMQARYDVNKDTRDRNVAEPRYPADAQNPANKLTYDELQRRRPEQAATRGRSARKSASASPASTSRKASNRSPAADEVGDYYQYAIDQNECCPGRNRPCCPSSIKPSKGRKSASTTNRSTRSIRFWA